MKTALVVGASGLTGQCIVRHLLEDERFSAVKIFVRRTMQLQHPKLQEYVIDFDNPQTWQAALQGDVLFSTLGTTIKKAGTKEAQYRIDHDYPLAFAKAAIANGVGTYALVSAQGANAKSSFFYMKMKGELDEAIERLGFGKVTIARPGMISGERGEKRAMEKFTLRLLNIINSIGLLRSYRPIEADTIAQALINASCDEEKGIRYLNSEQLRAMAHTA